MFPDLVETVCDCCISQTDILIVATQYRVDSICRMLMYLNHITSSM